MTKAVRLYLHYPEKIVKECYGNATTGINEIKILNDFYKPVAVGTEEGAMCAHYDLTGDSL